MKITSQRQQREGEGTYIAVYFNNSFLFCKIHPPPPPCPSLKHWTHTEGRWHPFTVQCPAAGGVVASSSPAHPPPWSQTQTHPLPPMPGPPWGGHLWYNSWGDSSSALQISLLEIFGTLSCTLQKRLCFSNLSSQFLESSFTLIEFNIEDVISRGWIIPLLIIPQNLKNFKKKYCPSTLISMACSTRSLNLKNQILYKQNKEWYQSYSLVFIAKSVLHSIPLFLPSLKEMTEWGLML